VSDDMIRRSPIRLGLHQLRFAVECVFVVQLAVIIQHVLQQSASLTASRATCKEPKRFRPRRLTAQTY